MEDEEQKKLQNKNENLKNYKKLYKIGEGSTGDIYLIQNRKIEKELYVIKVISKNMMADDKQGEHYFNLEKQIYEQLDHKFVIKMHSYYETDSNYIMLLDYCPGGDLFNLIEQKTKLTNSHLKPENILIDENGYIKITDFGSSKIFQKQVEFTETQIGFENYQSPEVVNMQRYNKKSDYWQLGCLIYEMLCGQPPFVQSEENQNLEHKILFSKIVYPQHFSVEAIQLLKQLLEKDPKKRLCDPQKIKKSRFFRDINFQKLLNYQIRAPFVPKLKSNVDISNFASEYVKMEITKSDIELSCFGDSKRKNTLEQLDDCNFYRMNQSTQVFGASQNIFTYTLQSNNYYQQNPPISNGSFLNWQRKNSNGLLFNQQSGHIRKTSSNNYNNNNLNYTQCTEYSATDTNKITFRLSTISQSKEESSEEIKNKNRESIQSKGQQKKNIEKCLQYCQIF